MPQDRSSRHSWQGEEKPSADGKSMEPAEWYLPLNLFSCHPLPVLVRKKGARVAKLVYARDLKSLVRKDLRVQAPHRVPLCICSEAWPCFYTAFFVAEKIQKVRLCRELCRILSLAAAGEGRSGRLLPELFQTALRGSVCTPGEGRDRRTVPVRSSRMRRFFLLFSREESRPD